MTNFEMNDIMARIVA